MNESDKNAVGPANIDARDNVDGADFLSGEPSTKRTRTDNESVMPLSKASDTGHLSPAHAASCAADQCNITRQAQFQNPVLANSSNFTMGLESSTLPSSSKTDVESAASSNDVLAGAVQKLADSTAACGAAGEQDGSLTEKVAVGNSGARLKRLRRHRSVPLPAVASFSTQVSKQGLADYINPSLCAMCKQRVDGYGAGPSEETAEPSKISPTIPPNRPSAAFLAIAEAVPKTSPDEPNDDKGEVVLVVAARTAAQPAAKPMVFMITGYTEAEKPDVVNTLSCHARVLEVNMLDPRATHMLCSKLSRTEKILACIGHGVMLLHPSYVTACQRRQQLISDAAVLQRHFEWGGEVQLHALRHEARNTPASRENCQLTISLAEAAKQRRQIFRATGQKPMTAMVCAIELGTSRASSFERVIQAAGGKIVQLFDKTDQPHRPLALHKDLSIVLVDKRTVALPELVRRYDEILRAGVHVLNIEFVAQFLSTAYPTKPNAVFPSNMSDLIFPVVQEKCNAIGRAVRMKPIWRALLGGRRIDLSVFHRLPPQPQPMPWPLIRNDGVNFISKT